MRECIRCRQMFAAIDSDVCDECLIKQALGKEISPMYIEKRIEQLEDVIPRLENKDDVDKLQREYEVLINKVQVDDEYVYLGVIE